MKTSVAQLKKLIETMDTEGMHCSCARLVMGVDHVGMRRDEAISLQDALRVILASPAAKDTLGATRLAQQQEPLLAVGARQFPVVRGLVHGEDTPAVLVWVALSMLKPFLLENVRSADAVALVAAFPYDALKAAVAHEYVTELAAILEKRQKARLEALEQMDAVCKRAAEALDAAKARLASMTQPAAQ